MEEALMLAQNQHAAVLKNANQKKEELKQRKIQEEIERENEKKRRAEEKARKKRERELQELRTMLNAEIIEKGETQEGAVKHRFTNEVGSYQPVPGVCVLGGVLGQFSIALECFIADKPALDDSLRDGEVVLKLFCDWLRSEQRVKVEIQKSAADISQLLADRELQPDKLPQVPTEDLLDFYFTQELLVKIAGSDLLNRDLLDNVRKAAITLEKQPADTKEELYAGAREHVLGVELPAQFREIDPAAILRVRVPLKRPDTAGTSAVSVTGGDKGSAAAPPTSAGPEGQEAKEASVAGTVQKSQELPSQKGQELVQQIQEIKDQVLVTRPNNLESGVAAYLFHQYGARMLRLNVLKFLMTKYADQMVEGQSVDEYAKLAEKKEEKLEKELMEGLGVPHFDIELN